MADSSALPPADSTMLANAVDILRTAGTFTLQWFDNPSLDVVTKSDGTPVTEADRGAERLIREQLATLHPEDSILGEELDDHIGSSGRTWIVDPIDGTESVHPRSTALLKSAGRRR